ncbi:interferon-inducible double-stranded RNA-dependent protein kinase activator A homolog [Cephus cinctus]|uniref:Interferon-inducible double-stranded RNA-dependent protein kinase activator A homolog n=1 Tax=Cephus cinctus TaxID=211228 RepID=A0AAJ7BNE9_CEPCN|nr:interferon-inducible double-stranded RNA-dependent protein kinase activator A homolog [Cephus cinctus]
MYNAGAEIVQGESKSSISMLQEFMMKGMKQLPNYTLIHDGGGTHLSSFTIRVECNGESVEATASSKKEAKHKAAQAMLNLLSKELVIKKSESVVPSSEIKSVNIIPHEVTFVNSAFNSIGKLQQ